MAAMTKWQHGELIMTLGAGLVWHGETGTKNQLAGMNAIDQLNELGAQGWQVVGITEVGNKVRYVLKREVVE